MLLVLTAPLWMPHPIARGAIMAVGALTALFTSGGGRTRPDAKAALAYATMTQLGLMFVETGLGWHRLLLVHAFAYAGLRAWQFLRSSSLIQDFQQNPMVSADLRRRHRSGWEGLCPAWPRGPLYLAAMRLFWLDALQAVLVVRPLQRVWGAA
jgi:NADH-quinone oxidoreductase subunit L